MRLSLNGQCISPGITTRRGFLGAMAGAAAGAGLAEAQGTQDKRPNVLFLAVDDMNDWVEGFGGHPQTVTPNLSKLAARGMRFQRAYCQAPMCNPSRASLLTGLRPTTTGIYLNDDTWRDGARGVITMPEHFMQNGYRVAGCGKIFHSKQTDFSCFHEYFKGKEQDEEVDPAEKPPKRNLAIKNKAFDWGPLDIPDEQTTDYKVSNYAAKFLSRKHDQPFFLACGLVKPHLPWYVPRKYFDKFPADKVKLPEYLDNDLKDVPRSAIRKPAVEAHRAIVAAGKWHEAVAAYLACINYADTNIGRVLDALWASPYAANTIVVVWGDHGWHLGEKEHWQKFTLWERSCRAPLIMAGPGVKPGTDCRRVMEFLDLYPTLSGMCGLPSKPEWQGRSITPLLREPGSAWDRPAITSHGPDKITVRTARWRYSRYPDGEELYDHDNDPNEWTNLASRPEQAARKRELAGLLPTEVNRRELRSWEALPPEEKAKLRGRARG